MQSAIAHTPVRSQLCYIRFARGRVNGRVTHISLSCIILLVGGVFIDEYGGNFISSLVLAVQSTAAILCLLDHVEIVDVIEACRSLLNLLNSILHAFILLPDNFNLFYVRNQTIILHSISG